MFAAMHRRSVAGMAWK